METALNISLEQNPTRQNLWRVVRFVSCFFGAFFVLVIVSRVWQTWNSVRFEKDVAAITIPKTAQNESELHALTRGLLVIPGVPYSLDDFLGLSSRGINVFLTPDRKVGVVIDRELAQNEENTLAAFGASVFRHDKETIIIDAQTAPTYSHSFFSGLRTTLFRIHDARAFINGESFGITFKKDEATLYGVRAITPPSIESIASESTIIFASWSGQTLSGLSSQVFTQNTPSLSAFFSLAENQGISAIVTRKDKNFIYTFSIPTPQDIKPTITESFLRELGSELTVIPTIDGITDYLDDGSRTTMLRSREEATVVLRDESPYRFLTATSSQGTVTITETPSFLTVSNGSEAKEETWPPCLANTKAFIRPATLVRSTPAPIAYPAQAITSLLWRADTIAASTRNTRICIMP